VSDWRDEGMKKSVVFVLAACLFVFAGSADAVSFVEHGQSVKFVDSDVIVHTHQGQPVLPDLEKARSQNEWGTRGIETKEITFTFDSPAYPWTDEELAALQQLVSECYPVMKKVYGPPAFTITVNVRKDPTLSTFAGLYNASTNEIVLRNADFDVFIHEGLHAFRDDLVIRVDSYEEGMARAAEVAVLAHFPQYGYWDQNHSYSIDVYYELNNQPGIGPADGSFIYGRFNPLLRYQQAGYAWGKMLIEDKLFPVKFNAYYYRAALIDPAVSGNVEYLRAIAGKLKPRVERKVFNQWYSGQHIFDTAPAEGYQLLFKADTGIIMVYFRDDLGDEYLIPDSHVTWEVRSCNGDLLSVDSDVTSVFGWVEIPIWMISSYSGRVQLNISAELPGGRKIEKTFFAYRGHEEGIFGLAQNCSGTVKIRHAGGITDIPVLNGSFSAPELGSLAGTFTIWQVGSIHKKTITKDASPYFVMLP
jgi:hypothetical protein